MILSRKAQNIGASLTLALTAKAGELKKEGIDVVSFGVGEPDFNTPKNIIEAATRAMEEGKTKYTATSGIVELKEAIARKLHDDNGLNYGTKNIIISTGAKQSLANVFMAILNPGDEVIIPVPYWVSYPELVKLSDGVPVFIETKKENDFKVTYDELKSVLSENTKAIVINSPNNPTGTVYSKKDLEVIAKFAKENDLIIISDEIYEKLIYGKEEHISIASSSEDAFKRTVVINGFSKAYAMTGWRIGYAACYNEELIKVMNNVQSHMTSNTNSIAQFAALEALNGDQETIKNMVKEFSLRRELMIELISEIEDLTFIEPKGAFYVMIDVSKVLKKANIKGSMEFANLLLKEENVVVIPGIAFGEDNFIRLSYATSKEEIIKGLKRIKEFVNKLMNRD
ncbi:TPA: pyridoxal phosphate-dependent aminotransferase [Clostridium perfringens]|uniref:pyridoxal phosphate-dependent aminotransferase n=1 Tax=Clostridium perfringens TaxID=1502 RepID=UPI000E158745|nr:pyridoxal phosphate-dependent aminotransferase [Clostridium perfringens]EJT5916123.1 pyridoxal phosphate-dependent aminotransferase [Clostridium perfringens]EJT5938296.1 pyridoxal phosphate-dependent aminotransferase [Clostridium perfringens]EJT6134949.1 pyridoxal phosphate-dependent aminotransferase [Clostridium perfringens]EJT6149943.1 pyridoxal phosphate-dependent aminotransferase [Clostridium perfringens]EJT6155348.1 pyridoxal phosphate-dependent aminotransferase [Clostridium perfringen